MLFYFTATGNSLYVAKQLEEEPVSIAQAIHDTSKSYRADRIGVVCPIFGHEVPELVRRFLTESQFETPYFYLILTYGNRHGGATELAKKLLVSLGITPAYINLVLMADNYLPAFDMNQQKALDKKVEEQIGNIKRDLEAGKHFIPPVTDKDRAAHREYLAHRAAMPEDTFSHLYRITDACIGCEICAKICPEQCFTVEHQKSRWSPEGCITCMACVHACPMMAIQLNIPEKNPKARYRNENISICEIIDANNQHRE